MLSAGLSVLSLSVLIGADAHKKDIRRFLLSGILAGLAYVIRYTAAPVCCWSSSLGGHSFCSRESSLGPCRECFWGDS